MLTTLQPIRVATGEEGAGMLVFDEGGQLLAVLVRLSDLHGVVAGQWFLEAGFGRLDHQNPTFPDLDSAQAWIADRVGGENAG